MSRKSKKFGKKTNAKKTLSAGTVNFVGLAVREMRLKRGLTQEQLTAQCQVRGLNLSRSGLAKIEACIRQVLAGELVVIGKVLNLTVGEFFPAGFGDIRRR